MDRTQQEISSPELKVEPSTPASLSAVFIRGIRDLSPAYFAMVMATGIVSIAAYQLSMPVIADALLVINLITYVVLWLLFLVRLARFSANLVHDFGSFTRAPGFFTIVAGTGVLGSQLVILKNLIQVAEGLWIFGILLWVILVYLFFFTMISSEVKPALESGINGVWLIAVVSTQSISVLGSLLAPSISAQYLDVVLFFTLFMYLLGCMLYLLLFGLVFYRLLFFHIQPEALSAPYWIGMGAIAITTLAGDRLMMNMSQWAFLANLLPFIQGFTLFFWAFATWLIPLLVLLGIWRHLVKRFPLRYDPQYWGMVFPLGMYTVSTLLLSKAAKLDFLAIIPQFFIYIALAAWLATTVGLVIHLVQSLLPVKSTAR